jgi:SAM-dependent methyltransferase
MGSEHEERPQEAYQDFGERALRFMAPPNARGQMHRFLARWLPATGDLLDVGCGSGELVAFAGQRGLSATGIDRDERTVARARSAGLDVLTGDVLNPPLDADRRFDVITMEHLIEHFDPTEAERLLCDYGGRLRPGGRLILVTPNHADWTVASEIFWLDPTHVRPYPARLLSAMLSDAGLRVLHTSSHRFVKLGLRSAFMRPIGRVRFGRQFERMNVVVVAERSHSTAPGAPRDL